MGADGVVGSWCDLNALDRTPRQYDHHLAIQIWYPPIYSSTRPFTFEAKTSILSRIVCALVRNSGFVTERSACSISRAGLEAGSEYSPTCVAIFGDINNWEGIRPLSSPNAWFGYTARDGGSMMG